MPENFTTFLSVHSWIFVLVVVWTIPWKGTALWKAARNQSVAWFVVLLVVNTLGILDIIYIFLFSKKAVPSQLAEIEETRKVEKKVLDIKREIDEGQQKS